MLVEKSNFTVTRMGRLLGVSRSGFYAWLGRAPSKRALRAERIEAKVAWFHGDSDEVSGSPRILATCAATVRHLPQDRCLVGGLRSGGRRLRSSSGGGLREEAPP